MGLVASTIKSITIRTAIGAPSVITGKDLEKSLQDVLKGLGEEQPGLMSIVKPTVIVDTVAGSITYAPFGAAGPDEWRVNQQKFLWYTIGGLTVIAGLSYYLGFRRGKSLGG